MTERVFEVDQLGGVLNPDRMEKCGPKDPNTHDLEPVHWGGCKGCKAKIVELLKVRYPAPMPAFPAKQAAFDFRALEDDAD